ncbi:MAG: hypothetical protein LHV68_04325 [Elusimicrobia bacterium]|nr:hypothetical protein [Candidatus Liberimonas magnetica]
MKIIKNKKIILGICGGISAYKVPLLVRVLKKKGADVTCILTANGARFVTPLTLRTLSQNKVYEDMFDEYETDIEHISLAKKADIVVIVPATADTLSRLSCGRAGDLVTSTVLSTKSPVLLCPAMNQNMWLHPATKNNLSVLKKYGYKFVEPQEGDLACGESGIGRLGEVSSIVKEIERIIG